MKKEILHLSLCGALLVGAVGAAYAQDATQTAPQTVSAGKTKHAPNPDKQLARLTKSLSLSADQQSQIKPILTDRDQQIQALHSDTNLSKQDKHAKISGILQDSDTKLQAVLNDDQKAKYAQIKQNMQEHHEHHGSSDSSKTATPPPTN